MAKDAQGNKMNKLSPVKTTPNYLRVASTIRLDPNRIDEYLEYHRNVWPEVLEQITASNIRNYSIFKFEDQLFSYFEYVGSNFDEDMKKMAEHEPTQRWWAIQEKLQLPYPQRKSGEWWMEIPEIFHLD